jgi:hypothetical protein
MRITVNEASAEFSNRGSHYHSSFQVREEEAW